MRVDRREEHGLRPDGAVRIVRRRTWSDLHHFTGLPVVTRHLAAVDEVWVERIRGDVAVLLDAERMPFTIADPPIVAPALHTGGPAFLLAAAHAIRECVVGADVVELRRRLVVPGAPRVAAVHRHHGALVHAEDHDVGIVWIDPEAVVVVATRRTAKRLEALAAVRGFPGDDAAGEDDVGIPGMDLDFGEVVPTRDDQRILRRLVPALPAVV